MYIRSITAALALAGFLQAKAASAAVQNGNYSGTQANNAGISMTVTTDTNTGKPEITGFGYWLDGNCKPSGTVNNTGWGFGPNVDFNGEKAHFVFSNGYFWVNVSLAVSGNSVTGTIASDVAILAPYTKAPKKALFCSIPAQKLTMTYQPAATAAAPQTMGAGHFNVAR